MNQTQASNVFEPPYFDGIEDLSPNGDHDNNQPQPRGKLTEAAAEFRKYFEKEPWFVRILLPADTLSFINVVVDARYWPKGRVKYRPWKGYPLAVSILTGLAAQAEKNALAEAAKAQTECECEHDVLPFPETPEGKRLVRLAKAFYEKYRNAPWFLEVFWAVNNAGEQLLHLRVDGRHWKKSERKSFHGVPVVVSIIPPGLLASTNDGEF